MYIYISIHNQQIFLLQIEVYISLRWNIFACIHYHNHKKAFDCTIPVNTYDDVIYYTRRRSIHITQKGITGFLRNTNYCYAERSSITKRYIFMCVYCYISISYLKVITLFWRTWELLHYTLWVPQTTFRKVVNSRVVCPLWHTCTCNKIMFWISWRLRITDTLYRWMRNGVRNEIP